MNLSEWRSPDSCQSPEVVPGTSCLPNTNHRCTWCGKRMPPPRLRTGQSYSERRWKEYARDEHRAGTDPLLFEAGEEIDYWEGGNT